MVDLPKKKVGIIACSGEELPEGTVTRKAALRVLEQLRPGDTVTICLPLFLAGGEGDRAFARFYPTIALDGCELRCAARATEMHSGKPAASVVIRDLIEEHEIGPLAGARRLDAAGQQAVDLAAMRTAELVDELLGKRWNRRSGQFEEPGGEARLDDSGSQESVQATCSCGSGIPVQVLEISRQPVTLVGLPLIFQQLLEAGKLPSETIQAELFGTVQIYNPIPAGQEEAYSQAILHAYEAYCRKERER